jgi:hypothetical protein
MERRHGRILNGGAAARELAMIFGLHRGRLDFM